MKAAVFEQFAQPLQIRQVPDPECPVHGAVVRVEANGICRSDWHGWMGHDTDVRLPHVPGHELAGVVVEVGPDVRLWRGGDRVTVPFACGCGRCEPCRSGQTQICDNYSQPGFTHWGAFAEYVAIHHADCNLVEIPHVIDSVTAASLGCRFATAFRAVVQQGQVRAGDWLAVHGCGGLGLSAIMIGVAAGAHVIGVDIARTKLELARELGAEIVLNPHTCGDLVAAIQEQTSGGAHLSIDALGSRETCRNSILSLRKQGRHVQVGLLLADQAEPGLPMSAVIARELQILGSHGMSAADYPRLLELIRLGRVDPTRLIRKRISLEEAPEELARLGSFESIGVTVIDRF